ncbi:hypothetical protein GCM10028827_08230 [Mucilaginibacter myungsuensis]
MKDHPPPAVIYRPHGFDTKARIVLLYFSFQRLQAGNDHIVPIDKTSTEAGDNKGKAEVGVMAFHVEY